MTVISGVSKHSLSISVGSFYVSLSSSPLIFKSLFSFLLLPYSHFISLTSFAWHPCAVPRTSLDWMDPIEQLQCVLVVLGSGGVGSIGSWGGVQLGTGIPGAWCTYTTGGFPSFFAFFFFFSYLFFILSRPFGGCFLFFSPLTLTSRYTFLKTSMIKTQLNPGAPLPLLASIGPLSIEACCEVALALNKVHSQWKLGRICDPPRHGHGHGPARAKPNSRVHNQQPRPTHQRSRTCFTFFFCSVCPPLWPCSQPHVSSRIECEASQGGPNAPYGRFFI
ncbi:hypothetical protein FALCPG4_003316 [Fusarium falciforme]